MSSTLVALFDHIDADRLRLHITDVTLCEMKRHIEADAEKALKIIADAQRLSKRWIARAPKTMAKTKGKVRHRDATKVGREAFVNFRTGLNAKGCLEHAASEQTAVSVLRSYFAREAPFEASNSKEFPDAFVIESLSDWCEQNETEMYVVTGDKAMLRAASSKPLLRGLDSLSTLLEIATIDHSPTVEREVEAIVQNTRFETALGVTLEERMLDVGAIYMGDLADGEAEEVEVSSAPRVIDWTIISSSGTHYGIIVEMDVGVIAQVSFEDRSMAIYDREDHVYFGAEAANAEVEDSVRIKMFVRSDAKGAISQSEMLTRDVEIYGPNDFDY